MELQLKKEIISNTVILDESVINQEEVGELTIPDTLPDVVKILDMYVTCLLKSKEAESGRTVVKGVFQTAVIYVSDDDNIYKADLPLPFSVTVNMQDVSENCEISAMINILNSDAVISNSRKIIVRVNYCTNIKTFNKEEIDVACAVDDESVFQLCDNFEMNYFSEYTEKTFVISDDVDAELENGCSFEILGAEYKLLSSGYYVSGNRLIIQGCAEAKLLILSSDDVCPKELVKHFDFSQIIDIDNMNTVSDISVNLMLNGCYCDINSYVSDKPSLNVELHAVAQCIVFRNRTLSVLSDAYSVNGALELNREEHILVSGTDKTDVSCEFCERFDNISNIKEIVSAKIKVIDIAEENSKTKLKCMLIGYGFDGNLVPQSIRYSFSVMTDDRLVSNSAYSAEIQNIELFGNEIIFEDEINVISEKLKQLIFENITDAKLEICDVQNNAPSVVLYRYKPSDTIWNIAKKYLSSSEIIRDINEIEDETQIEEGRMILIPKV